MQSLSKLPCAVVDTVNTRNIGTSVRIKKIELIGFKSFADRTEVLLNPGVTCIVGPNGCGKSNISDAIRWVLGERSAKLLRGGQMQDVIFNGTDFRKPIGMAEVSLFVDNSDHCLPIEYEEVVFSRRLYRSGESEYLINRTPCRLKDILDLILDTGMGSNSYSMIEQGRIDFILSADPEERRFLIEEAAGISKYKVKKEEAIRKLERTEENLLRIKDIVTEVRRNIQYAERQAKRAEQYKSQFEVLKTLEVKKAFWELAEISKKKEIQAESKGLIEKQIADLEAEISDLKSKQQTQKFLLDEILKKEAAEEARRFEVRAEFQNVSQKREFNRERLQEYRARQIEIEREKEKISLTLQDLEKDAAQKIVEREELQEEFKTSEEDYQREKRRFEEEEALYRTKRQEADPLREKILDHARESAKIRNELNRLETLQESAEREGQRRREIKSKWIEEKTELEKRLIRHREDVAQANHELEELRGEEARIQNEIAALKEVETRILSEWNERNSKIQEISTRLKLLGELEETDQEAEEKLRGVISHERVKGKLIRLLREVLQVEPGYEAAVEAMLGSYAQGLIAEDVECAKGLIKTMTDSHLGPCGIFVQNIFRSKGRRQQKEDIHHPLIRHRIEEVVKFQAELEPLFAPFFENVYVVEKFSPDDLNDLLPLADRVRLVTRDGVILGPESRIFFRNGRLSRDQGSLHRQGETNRLGQQRDCLLKELSETEARKSDVVRQKENLLKTSEELNAKAQEGAIRREASDSLISGMTDRITHLEEELRVLSFEISESAVGGVNIEEQKALLSQRLADLDGEGKKLATEQKDLETWLDAKQVERDKGMQEFARLKARHETRTEKIESLEQGESWIRTQIQVSQERNGNITLEFDDLGRKIQVIRGEESGFNERLQELQNVEGSIESLLTEIRGRKGFQLEGLEGINLRAGEIQVSLSALRDTVHTEEMELMQLSYQEKNIYERLEQSYRIKLTELKPEDYPLSAEEKAELEDRIGVCKSKVETFGAVNLLAVDEYDELKQRYDFLSKQENDLVEARESLLEAIRKINRTTKVLFHETFQKVQSGFLEHFHILFGGGHAELVLLDGENPQESGVDIVARPPGKKPQHISLLSGGEKALTALALLFALFKIKPAPFCVLDEVDAPLDEANIDRFLNVLRTFLDSTQFLIVTHNRKTIAMGDYLYGVTMQESGVSKIVSVKVVDEPVKAKTEEKVTA